MAKATFKMKFGGFNRGVGKTSQKPFFNIKLLEEVENFGNLEVQLTSVFGGNLDDEIVDKIADLDLYDDVIVVLDVFSSGRNPQFIDIEKA